MPNLNISKRSLSAQRARLLNKKEKHPTLFTKRIKNINKNKLILERNEIHNNPINNKKIFILFSLFIVVSIILTIIIGPITGAFTCFFLFLSSFFITTYSNKQKKTIIQSNVVKKYLKLDTIIAQNIDLLNNETQDILKTIQEHYLLLIPIIEKDQIYDIDDRCFIISSIDKHIPEIISQLNLIPIKKITPIQIAALEQFKNIEKKLSDIVDKHIFEINKKIRLKSVITSPD